MKLVKKDSLEFKKEFSKPLMRSRLRRQAAIILNKTWLMKKELIIK